MVRTRFRLFGIVAALVIVSVPWQAGSAQVAETTVLDSIAVRGARRVDRSAIVSRAGLPLGQPISYRDVQRAIAALYATGQFEDVKVYQGTVNDREILVIEVAERPILAQWTVRGVTDMSERTVRGRVSLAAGRPYDRAAAVHSQASIDSLYREKGYYRADVNLLERIQPDGTVRVFFDVAEGSRVAISQVLVEGNDSLSDRDVAGSMKTKPEGFWWFRKGEYDEEEIERDIRERLPGHYGSKGFVDFAVVEDTLLVNDETGKGTLVLTVREGDKYEIGNFEIIGNRVFTTEQLEQFYPFERGVSGFMGLGGARKDVPVFDEEKWLEATQNLATFYNNNGYLYADIRPVVQRRTRPDGGRAVDLRWQIVEGSPAIVNKIEIRGNTVTHEDVIRRQIIMVPGDVFRQDAMITSYQRISNLGFFEQPLPIPRIEPANRQGDVNVVFEVAERNSGNVNFGASVGQGTGIGGFVGMTQPNLFGKGKEISFQWQFGRNISDFQVSYTDPAIRGGLLSGTVNLHNTRLRFTVGDLGRITTRGGSVQIGFPLFGSRFTRLFTSYTFEQQDFNAPTLVSRFNCDNCALSSLGLGILRDTRVGLPFATGGSMSNLRISQTGGVLGGSGDFRRATYEGRWYAPLAQLGGAGINANPTIFVLGFTGKVGMIWGDPGPHFRQLFTMGGTQFGIPLRGYEEFSITPRGFDPLATGTRASTVDAFGASYVAMTGEIGVRLSQMFYLNTFMDAGNVWANPGKFNPTNLFKGAGVGLSLLSPLGPIGIDYAYGFDRTDLLGNPDPQWKFHFKIGNFF